MGNWGCGADLWVVGLLHGHTLRFVANQVYLSKEVKALHVYSRGLLWKHRPLRYYWTAAVEDWSDAVEACNQLCVV